MASKIDAQIIAYIAKVQEMNDALFAKEYPGQTPPTITREDGKRYCRIIKDEHSGSSRSVHSFVEMETGAILKAAGWKTPYIVKGRNTARGNVSDLTRGFDSYGAWSA